MQDLLKKLETMTKRMGPRQTTGLSQQEITEFLPEHPLLAAAIEEGFLNSRKLLEEFPFFGPRVRGPADR